MRLEGLKVGFLGDSIIEGHGVDTLENIFWRRFEKDGCICRGLLLEDLRKDICH